MNIDAIIVFSYLLITLGLGLYWSRSIKDIKDYALGGRNFSTAVLAATIIATHASGSGFFLDITKSYEDGIYKLLATSGQTFRLLFTAFFIAPRMVKFINKLSVAEMMGDLYGQRMRILSSLPIFLVSAGFVAVQIKVLSSTLEYFTEIGRLECIILTSIIVIIYSALGGVRAVTFTDVVQFITFAIAIPVIFLIVYSSLDLTNNVENKEALFDHLFNLDESKQTYYITLFIYLLIPSLSPPAIQRLLMARNTSQMLESYKASALVLLFFLVMFNILGALLYVSNPNLQSNLVMPYMIDNFTYPGLKGLFLIAVIALAMSTADSNLNAGAVSFSHDFCRPLGIFKKYSELTISKIFSIIIGLIAIILALNFQDVISLILFVHNFYAPIITVPLMLAIFGFKASTRSVIAGMFFGILTVLTWSKIQTSFGISKNIDSFIPGMLAHLIALLITNYFTTPPPTPGPGNNNNSNITIKKQNISFFKKIANKISSPSSKLNLNQILNDNLSQSIFLYNNLAVYIFLLFFLTFLSSGRITKIDIAIFFFITIFASSLFICNFIKTNKNTIINLSYFVACIFCFPLSSVFLLFYTDFSPAILILSAISILLMPILMSWSFAVVGNFIGIASGVLLFNYIYGFDKLTFHLGATNLILFALILILLASFLISRKTSIYLRELIQKNSFLMLERKNLDNRLLEAEKNINKLVDLKSEILNNFSHEVKTPLHNLGCQIDMMIETVGDTANQNLLKLTKCSKDYFKKLENYLLRVVDLSNFQKKNITYNIEEININELIKEISFEYRKYLDIRLLNMLDKEDDSNSFTIWFDRIKLKRIFRELIENSILHAKADLIEVALKYDHNKSLNENLIIEFTDFSDIKLNNSEISITKNIERIFEPFEILGSGEKGYRGLGLALVKEITQAHQGSVTVSSPDNKLGCGLKFTFKLLKDPRSKIFEKDSNQIQDNKSKQVTDKKYKILLVDDDEEVLKSSSMLLEFLGHEVYKVCSGSEAIDFIEMWETEIDIILLDIMMPDKNGIEVLEQTSDVLKAKGVKVIIQSGAISLEEINAKAPKLGISYFCPKPYNLNDLKNAINSI